MKILLICLGIVIVLGILVTVALIRSEIKVERKPGDLP